MTCYARLLIVLLALPACEEDDDPTIQEDETTTSAAESSSSSSSTTGSEASPFDCVEQNFMPTPLAGPGIDPETGALVGAPQNSYVLHTTQAVVTPETAEALTSLSNEVIAQAMAADGVIALSFSFDQTCGFARTLGIWESEEKMLAFVVSGAHEQAMEQAPDIIATGRFTHFDIPAEDVDRAWEVALEHLATVEPPEGY